MPIILSQHIDYDSEYEDIPFSIYHYPKRYRNQIRPGDVFIYYQGDRQKKENRYYFGYGVIGSIDISPNGEHYYANIIDGMSFPQKVPIYKPTGGFYESIAYQTVRNSQIPPWQNSIRKLSDAAFKEILTATKLGVEILCDASDIEKQEDPIYSLILLNDRYSNYSPEKKNKIISAHIDRGKSVTNSLKAILGATCQICGITGFQKNNGERYIEAHHLAQLSQNLSNSLCTDNIILVCPNCHREIHYGKNVCIEDRGLHISIVLSNVSSLITKNTILYLQSRL
jgi:5-methylcytosine-specific restriction endonuclease McrA